MSCASRHLLPQSALGWSDAGNAFDVLKTVAPPPATVRHPVANVTHAEHLLVQALEKLDVLQRCRIADLPQPQSIAHICTETSNSRPRPHEESLLIQRRRGELSLMSIDLSRDSDDAAGIGPWQQRRSQQDMIPVSTMAALSETFHVAEESKAESDATTSIVADYMTSVQRPSQIDGTSSPATVSIVHDSEEKTALISIYRHPPDGSVTFSMSMNNANLTELTSLNSETSTCSAC